VICLNPLSSGDDPPSPNPLDWPAQASRRANGRRLGHEARKVRGDGAEVALIQPTAPDLNTI
jgi:NTE family protein